MTVPSTTNPVTVALVLTSGIYPGPIDEQLLSTSAMAAASDGSLWITSSNGLFQYSTSTGAFEPMSNVEPYFSQFGPYLAAVNAALAYWLTTGTNSQCTVSCYTPSGVTTLPPLPGTDTPTAISAGADGTLWVIGAAGAMYSYNAASSAWTAMSSPPGQLLSLSVGGASTILALTAGAEIYAYANGAWTLQTTTNVIDASWLGACLDGSYWLGTENGPTLVLPGGAEMTFQIPAGTQVYGMYAAGSRYGCYCVGYIPGPPVTFGILTAGYGVTEQPAQSWPAMTPDQQTAYAAINTEIGTTDPAGVRASYANLDAPLSDYFTIVTTMAQPAGVTAADWAIVQSQIREELEFAQSVQNLFQNIKILNVEISTIQIDEYNEVVGMVGLPDNPNDQPDSIVSIVLGDTVETLFAAAVLGAPVEVQQLILVGMSVYNYAADAEAQKHALPNRNTALQIACAQLAGTLADMQIQAVSAAAAFETAILSDWGMLSACGASIRTNVWYWPPNFDVHVLDNAATANAINFYQTLMPVKWQIMQIQTVWATGVGGTVTLPNVPAYALMYSFLEASDQSWVEGWWTVVADQGASADPYTGGPFPNQALIEAINAVSSGALFDMFTGTNGWQLPVVQMNDYTPAPANATPVPWLDSSSPVPG